MKEVIIDGEIYVPQQQDKEMALANYSIVRTYTAGVFAGYIESRSGREVVIRQARRLWYWDGAASLSQMAVDGVNKPQNCKFPVAVSSITVLEAIEILPCTEKARKSIEGVPVWQV